MLNGLAGEKIIEAIKGAKSALVSAHVSPDPDAVGSAGALTLALRENGKDADLYFFDTLPQNFMMLLGDIQVRNEVPCRQYDLLIVLDTATKLRAGADIERVQEITCCTLNIDHHVSNELWGELNYIDGEAAASAEIVFNLLDRMGWSYSSQVANLLYAGIMDDTGSFRYSNTSAKALLAASQLVICGANPAAIANTLYFSTPSRVIKLRADSSQTIELHFGGRFSTIYVTQEMLQSNGCTSEDTEALVDIARSIQGVEACAFMREAESNWKISLRSKSDDIDVNRIAQLFGGGGHKAAAGCKIVGSLTEIKSKILGEFAKIIL